VLRTPLLGNFTSMVAGMRAYVAGFGSGTSNITLIVINDGDGNEQCALRATPSGALYFTHNGTMIGTPSSSSLLSSLTWAMIEFRPVLSTTGGGTCEVRINGAIVMSQSGLTNATNFGYGLGEAVTFGFQNSSGADAYLRDFYVVDALASNVILGAVASGVFAPVETVTQATSGASATLYGASTGKLLIGAVTGTPDGTHTWTGGSSGATFTPSFVPTPSATSYLGDVNVVEVYPNGAGVNSAWAANVGPFTVTAVSGSGTSWTFTGSWTTGASNAYLGYNFNTTGCGSGNNQTGVQCTASAAGSITLSFSGGSNQTGLSGTAAFQCLVQAGINKDGTRPNGDVAYISDANSGDISDFAHQSLNTALGRTFSGIILGFAHFSYMRKDDLGSRQVAQVCLSSSATAVSGPISLGNTYQYWVQILETDPNTLTQFSASGLNATTLGVKELT